MGAEEVRRNAGQIEKYLEVLLPILEPGGGIPENPMNRKERGESRPPVPDHIHALWDANPDLWMVNAILEQAAKSPESVILEGRPMWKILGDALWDHTAIRAWKAKGGVHERRLWQTCLLLAQRLAIRYDRPGEPVVIEIVTRPEDEQERQRTQEAKTLDHRHTQRRMIRELEAIEAEGYPTSEAMEMLEERAKREGKEWTVRKQRDARTFVNKERRGEATESQSDRYHNFDTEANGGDAA